MKTIFYSKTFWFGVGQILFGAVGYFTGWIDHQLATGLMTTGVASVWLRFKTSVPVSLSGE